MTAAGELEKLGRLHAQGVLSDAEFQQAKAKLLHSAGPQHDPSMKMLLPVGRTALSIAAGYLGLFSLLVVPAPLALVVGILALIDLRRKPDKTGAGRAWFGIIMGAAGTALIIALALAP